MLENAYLRQIEETGLGELHKKITLKLLFEKRHYSMDELKFLTQNNEKKLLNAIKELESKGFVKTEGWLVKIAEAECLIKISAKK